MLTMVGLLMAIGVLMDDGIVIAENIARRRSAGEPAMTAAVNGVSEVGGGVFSSFLTTCSVLGPLMFITGDMGRVLRVLPMMLLLVLAASLIEAFLILPGTPGSFVRETRSAINAAEFVAESIRRSTPHRSSPDGSSTGRFAWRYADAGLVAMIFLLTIGLLIGGVVRGQVFPSLEGDTIVARVLMRPGTPLKRTSEVVADLEVSLAATNASFKPSQPEQRIWSKRRMFASTKTRMPWKSGHTWRRCTPKS